MTGRRIRTLLILAALAALGYWIYADRPTVPGIIDAITSPLMGSKAAVGSSERNRVVGDASAKISEQNDSPVGALREGMTQAEVRDLLGNPDKVEKEVRDRVEQVRWTFKSSGRVVVLQDGRVVSIVVIP